MLILLRYQGVGITERQDNKQNKIVAGVIISIGSLLLAYFGMAVYFINHFYFGSEINGVNVSCETIEEAEGKMASYLKSYTLILKERYGKSEEIRADEIGLMYNSVSQLKDFKDRQDPFKWFLAPFQTEDLKITMEVSLDYELLRERVDRLSCFDKNNVIEPKNPIFVYKGSGYAIVDEIKGNKVDKDILYDHIVDAILNYKTELDLEAIDCYIKPQYTSKSQKIIDVRDKLNKYASSRIIYTFGEQEEVINGPIISKWLKVDENYEIIIDEGEGKNYIAALSNKYGEVGEIKDFATSSGSIINISGGDYRCSINADKEIQELREAIKEGKTIKKEPTYVLSTYVEIDLSRQHLWFYKNGSLITEGNIVSGDISKNMATPEGVYQLKGKWRNAILRGPGYEVPVDYWMPFNGGIGIHDATWRHAFGGQIYKYNGSHGCINCPYSLAEKIFENIVAGTPVICYY